MNSDLLTLFWMGGVILFGIIFFALAFYLAKKSTASQPE